MKTLLLTLVLLVTSSAWADWVPVAGNATAEVYVDLTSVRKDGNLRKVWKLMNFKQRDKFGYMSYRSRGEYDCKEERYRFLAIIAHTNAMGEGGVGYNEPFPPSPWREIAPGNSDEDILKLVCAQ